MEMEILTSLPLMKVINYRSTVHFERIKSDLKGHKIKRTLNLWSFHSNLIKLFKDSINIFHIK